MQGSRTSSMLRWRTPERPLGRASFGEASISGWWGASRNGRRAKGSGSPSIPRQVETASATPSEAPQGGATGISSAPTGLDHRIPPPRPEAPGGGGGGVSDAATLPANLANR